MKFRITNVDMNGYLGRERHPSKEDEGKIVTLIGAETLNMDSMSVVKAGYAEKELSTNDFIAVDSGAIETVLFCAVEASGRILDLMEHEVERVR